MSAFPDQTAVDYDERIVRRVPGYRLGQELIAALLANRLKGDTHILVAGCGTGEELVELARSLPAARFTAVDPSAGMLQRAASKANAHGLTNRIRFVPTAVEDTPRETCDAAVASLVLHFLRDDGAKADFLHALADRLCDGAPLVLIDPANTCEFDEDYRQWMMRQGLDGEAANDVLVRMQQNWFRATPERLSDLLVQAGFEGPRLFFMALGYRGVVARRNRAP